MKTLLRMAFVLLLTMQANAQDIPTIKVGEDRLGITSLDVKVDVVGNIATTTYDMLFYNPTNAVLEGELAFPLAEGQRVSRLALEVNGKLREAVVVEKERGRVAFEAVVRRGVDPVLLEKGTGNNYKARIYPIPAKGYKRVVLAHEQELIFSEDAHYFQLPLGFKKNLDMFSIAMSVFDQKTEPTLTKGSLENFEFSQVNKSYTARFSKKNYTPGESLTIKIPQAQDQLKTIIFDDYIYSYQTLDIARLELEKPKSITIFWDASLSMADRELAKELEFIGTYLQYLQNVNVEVITFSNDVRSQDTFNISNGNWDMLKNLLKNVVYDGGTSFECLKRNINSDTVLLFSDGMKNLSEINVRTSKPVYVVNSLIKANHSKLKAISTHTNAKYINLKQKSVSEALDEITSEAFKFLGYTTSNKAVEFYPKAPLTVSKDFSIAAKGLKAGDVITLKFGYGSETTLERTITVDENVENELVKRFWAQKKLDELQQDSEANREAIVSHAKAFSLVSDHTSLIVLESVWDYVNYNITPPDELKEEYNRIMTQYKNKRVVSTTQEDDTEVDDVEAEEVVIVETANSGGNLSNATISGTVRDASGPLPGVNVIIKGTSNGTQTDFDGNYTITASTGDILVYSYVGFTNFRNYYRWF